MNDYAKKMIDDAIRRIDSLTIDELEREFKSFGLNVVRKKGVTRFTSHFSSTNPPDSDLNVVKKISVQNSDHYSHKMTLIPDIGKCGGISTPVLPPKRGFNPVTFFINGTQACNDAFYCANDFDNKIAA